MRDAGTASETAPKDEWVLGKLLDQTLVGVSGLESIRREERAQELATFSQRDDSTSTVTTKNAAGLCSISEVSRAASWISVLLMQAAC